MNKTKIISFVLIASFVVASFAGATCTTCNTEETDTGSVNSITLTGTGANISWSTDGYSSKGFKVSWSKNSGPTYPTRSGDKYHYHSSPSQTTDTLTTFDGDGTYYVRVCEYLSGACGVYSNEISVVLGDGTSDEPVACTLEYAPVCGKDGKTYSNKCLAEAAGTYKAYYGECKKDKQIIDIEKSAEKLINNDLAAILAELKELRNLVREQQTQILHLQKLLIGVAAVTEAMQSSINSFITYGVDDNTKKLGEGERAAVIYSFKEAFGKLPEDETEMADAIKIANGRWPSKLSEVAEEKAKEKFKYIYKRAASAGQVNDDAAVVVMAYGLRQKAENRNLNSEQNGLKIFKDIYGYLPESTEDWNALQAITYSGATR